MAKNFALVADIVYEAIWDEERKGKPPRRANPVLLFSAEELLTYASGAQRQGCKRRRQVYLSEETVLWVGALYTIVESMPWRDRVTVWFDSVQVGALGLSQATRPT